MHRSRSTYYRIEFDTEKRHGTMNTPVTHKRQRFTTAHDKMNETQPTNGRFSFETSNIPLSFSADTLNNLRKKIRS